MSSSDKNSMPWSIAYTTQRILLKDSVPLEVPLCICIEPTNICNFKCLMCWQSTEEYKRDGGPFYNMDMGVFRKIILDIKELCEKNKKKIKLIKLYSTGEPLLHPEINIMVKEIKEAGICENLEITTNAALLTKELAESFVDLGLDYLRVSIYSVLPERHMQVTQSKITPKCIANNVKYLKAYRTQQGKDKPYITAKIMDTHSSENDIFKEMYKSISDEQLIDVPWELPKLEENALDKLYGSKENGSKAEIEYLNKVGTSTKQVCRYPFTHLTVRNNGDAVVCCIDWARDTKIGNICNQTIENIWISKALYNFRVMQLTNKGAHHPLCRECLLPLQNKPEDDLSGVRIEKLKYYGMDCQQ